MKVFFSILLAVTATFGTAATTDQAVDDLPDREYAYEIFRHLYRWYLDADQLMDARGPITDYEIEVWVRRLETESDPEDRSLYMEMLIPSLKTEIILKKADYSIPETGESVQNKDYRIALIDRYETPPGPEEDYLKITFPGREVFDHLYETRNQKVFPDSATRHRLGAAVRARMTSEDLDLIEGDQVIYVAPLSPVTNDIWVFWESQRKIIKFTSDADYDSEYFWKHHKVGFDILDLDTDIVISHTEKPGSNAYVTKDVVGRILFNCIVLGERTVVSADRVKIDPGP